MFVDALARFAEQSRDPRLTPMAERRHDPSPLPCSAAAGSVSALSPRRWRLPGVTVAPETPTPTCEVMVLAEVVKPEDLAMIAA